MDLNPLLADGEGAAHQVSQPSCPQKSSFDVLGICCSSEVPLIENILKSIEGVKEVSVIVPTRTVIVIHDSLLVSQLQIVKALNQARLEANVRVHGERKYQKKWPNPFAMACGVLLLLSFLKYAYHPLQWLAVGAVVIGIWPILLKGYAAIRNFRLDVNILMLIAVIGSVALKDYTEAGIIVFLFTIADWLDSRASHKATAVMSSLISLAPQKAVIAETGEEVDADEVEPNTILAVKAGEVIPIDGVVVDGKCEVDEKTLTGESLPVTKEKDSIVWAGTINLNGYISIRTTAVAEDCVVAKMAKLVEEVQNSKSTTQRFIDKCAQFYTPAIIIISAAIAVIPAALRVHNLKHWFHLALVVLVTACPCALVLSTPVASFCALTKAATSGLLVKGSDYLEILSKIKIVAFDKTGTLTRGEFLVTDFRSLTEDISLNTLLYWVSSIESKSSHPMAAALVEYGRLQSIEPNPETVENYENFPGEGIYGRIDGRDIYIGSRKISVRANGTVPNLEGNMIGGKTIGYVFSGQTPVGAFSLSDACRTGAAEAVDEIRSMGIKAVMLTGDNQASAMHVQEQLGNRLDIVHAELLPEDKARFIKEFKDEGPTAMIGDGINDAPALATADIGISMGISGSALATETGHVILMSNDVRKIPTAIKLARKAHRKVIENVILSISTKVAILALAFAGHPLVWAAVLADVGTCLLVICNSMLLLREKGCKSSSGASLADKHGCKTSHSHSSHSHGHHHNDGIVQKLCETKQCSSQSCASKSESCQSSSINSCKSNCNQGSCKTTNPKTTKSESQNCYSSKTSHCHSSHSHGHHHNDKKVQKPCETKHCSLQSCASKSERCQSSSINSCKSNCNQGSCKTTNPKTTKSESQSCCSSNQNLRVCSEEDKHSKAKHCDDLQGHNCGENHTNNSTALGSCVEKRSCSESESLKLKAADSHSHLAIDITMSPEHEACRRPEKRDIGGCCKRYRKECCGKHGHFGGGLTEIIITE